MQAKNRIAFSRCMVVWSILWSLHIGNLSVHAEVSDPMSLEVQQQKSLQEIQSLLQTAETYFKEEQYSDAFRKLYDAVYCEKKNALYEDSYGHLYVMVGYLIHDEPSSLMQYLRNKDVPFQEKNRILRELETLITQTDAFTRSLGQGKYIGPLIDILTSPKLRADEKDEIMHRIIWEVRKNYISEEQKNQEINNINQNLEIADQKMREGRYVEAFRLFDESVQRESEIGISGNAVYGYMEFLDFLASREASPMMLFLRNTTISLQEKQSLLAELTLLAQEHSLKSDMKLAQEQFRGPLTDLMMDTTLTLSQRMGLLNFVRDVIEKEYSPLP